jgi:hypothetical protein
MALRLKEALVRIGLEITIEIFSFSNVPSSATGLEYIGLPYIHSSCQVYDRL